jgi:hypothetical protein
VHGSSLLRPLLEKTGVRNPLAGEEGDDQAQRKREYDAAFSLLYAGA